MRFVYLVVVMVILVSYLVDAVTWSTYGDHRRVLNSRQSSVIDSNSKSTNRKKPNGRNANTNTNNNNNNNNSMTNINDSPFGVYIKNCPVSCVCQGLSVDCCSRGLKQVPKSIPTNAIKMYDICYM
jgi:hypothetical protein